MGWILVEAGFKLTFYFTLFVLICGDQLKDFQSFVDVLNDRENKFVNEPAECKHQNIYSHRNQSHYSVLEIKSKNSIQNDSRTNDDLLVLKDLTAYFERQFLTALSTNSDGLNERQLSILKRSPFSIDIVESYVLEGAKIAYDPSIRKIFLSRKQVVTLVDNKFDTETLDLNKFYKIVRDQDISKSLPNIYSKSVDIAESLSLNARGLLSELPLNGCTACIVFATFAGIIATDRKITNEVCDYCNENEISDSSCEDLLVIVPFITTILAPVIAVEVFQECIASYCETSNP